MLRKIVAAIVLVPLAVLIIAFAVANRQAVVISFDPFDAAQPAYSIATRFFVPILGALIVGVLIGGAASWWRQGKWRGAARRFERDLQVLRGKLAAMETMAENSGNIPGQNIAGRNTPGQDNPPARLRLKPPVR